MKRGVAVVVAVCLALVPTLSMAGTPLGAETPQALVTRLNKAAAAGDIAELTACMDPESRVEMATAMLLGTTMMIGFMGLGAEMAEGMAEGMSDAMDAEPSAEQKAKMAQSKAEAAAKMEKTKAQFSSVLKKHGLPDLLDEKAMESAGDPEELLGKADQPALVADLMGIMEGLGEGGKKSPSDEMPDLKNVTDYKIDGDKGTARAGDETIEFVKIDGRWFVKPEKKKEAAPAAE